MPRLLSAPRRAEAVRDSSATKASPRPLQEDDCSSRSARNQESRVRRLLGRETPFVGSDSFRDPATARRLRSLAERMEREAARPAAVSYSARNAAFATCAPGIAELLSPSEERDAFLCLNYLRWQANVLRATIDPAAPDKSLIGELEALHRQALVVRDRIISANLRLVMSIAKFQAGARSQFDELFSEGVPVLLRAVEKFDVERGFRFSTYAYTAVRRALQRAQADAQRDRRRQVTSVENSVLERSADDAAATDALPESAFPLVRELLERLPPRENLVVRARFGMLPDQADRTLQEVGGLLGVSKERARQLLNRAFARLRTLIAESHYAGLQELAEPDVAANP